MLRECSLKPGRVVVLLAGRRAGKKAVIVKPVDEAAKKGRKYPHCLVAGLERYPQKVTRRMGAKKVARRCKLRPFVKYINYTHVMPTRYFLLLSSSYVVGPDLDLKTIITDEAMK